MNLPKNAEGINWVSESLADTWAPVANESVCDWVEGNIELPTGAITGKVRLNKTPYLREILERYGDKQTRHLVLAFATQLGKTSCLIYGMLYRLARRPEDAMWVFGNTEQARGFNKERFMPAVHLCAPVLDLVPRTMRGAIDKHLWGFQSQHYKSMVLNFVGAGSRTNLSSRPCGFLQLDEVDKYYDELKFDAGTIDLVEARQKAAHFPLVVKASSPTTEDRMIWAEYEKTDRRQFWVPCPRCEQEILLGFTVESETHGDCGVRWWHENEAEAKTDGEWDLKKVRANAFYKCQRCGGMIHSFERQDMMVEAASNPKFGWKPSNERNEPGRFGYQLGSQYGILSEETSLGAMAVKFLLSRGLISNRKDFINGWLGEPWDEMKAHDFKEVQLKVFSPASIPEDAITLMAIDCQQKGFWVVIRKFAQPSSGRLHGESWLLYADFVETEEELVELQEEYEVEGSNVTADMAHRPNQVARMILKHKWTGIWGSPNTRKFAHPGPGGTRLWRIFSQTQWRDPMLGTKWESRQPQRAPFILFSKHDALDLVSSLRYAEPAIWHATLNVSPRYSRHLNSRVKRMEKSKKTGRPEWIWYELHQENHLADCESHVAIKAMTLGLISAPNESDSQVVQK